MASLTSINEGNRKGWKIQFRDLGQRKRVLWLGRMPKRTAENFKANVEQLLSCKAGNDRPAPQLAAWLAEGVG